jgi:type I restriction enzyme S subunit
MPEEVVPTSFSDLIADGVLEIGDGYRAKLSELGGDGPIFLRAGRLSDGGLDFDGAERFRSEVLDRVGQKLGEPGDTIITTKGNSVGRSGFVPNNCPPFAYSPHLSFWRSRNHERLVPAFLRYWAKGPEFRDQLTAMAHGTDMAPYLSLTDQRRLRITLLPPAQQRSASDVLLALDDKIESNACVFRTAPALAAALLRQTSVAANRTLLGTVAEVRKGLSYKGAGLADAGMPMVNLANAAAFGGFKRRGWKYYTGAFKQRHLVRGGDLLVANTEQTWRNEILGWPMLLPADMPEALFSQDVSMIDFAPEWQHLRLPVWAHLFTREARNRVEGMAHGTTVARFPAEALTGLEVPVIDPGAPVLADAEALLRRAWAAERESEALARLRDALLPALMSGRLRVREAEERVGEAV